MGSLLEVLIVWQRVCEHKFVYQGLFYRDGTHPLPGSSARERTYFDRYFCEKCLHTEEKDHRVVGNNYQKVLSGATPAPPARSL